MECEEDEGSVAVPPQGAEHEELQWAQTPIHDRVSGGLKAPGLVDEGTQKVMERSRVLFQGQRPLTLKRCVCVCVCVCACTCTYTCTVCAWQALIRGRRYAIRLLWVPEIPMKKIKVHLKTFLRTNGRIRWGFLFFVVFCCFLLEAQNS